MTIPRPSLPSAIVAVEAMRLAGRLAVLATIIGLTLWTLPRARAWVDRDCVCDCEKETKAKRSGK